MTTRVPECDGVVIEETTPEPRVLVVDDRWASLRALLPLLALAGLSGSLPVAAPPSTPRRPAPPPTGTWALGPPRLERCPHGVARWSPCRECLREAAIARGGSHAEAVNNATNKRARKAAKLEEIAARNGILKK